MNFDPEPEDTFSVLTLSTNLEKVRLVIQLQELPMKAALSGAAVGAGQRTVQAQVYSPLMGGRDLFVNDVALLACERLGVAVPRAAKVIARRELPPNIAVDVEFPYFNGRPSH